MFHRTLVSVFLVHVLRGALSFYMYHIFAQLVITLLKTILRNAGVGISFTR